MQILVNINGVQSGPISREALAEIVTDPSVTYVWHQGMSNWERIDRLPEFADIVAAASKAPAVPEIPAEPAEPELSDQSDSSEQSDQSDGSDLSEKSSAAASASPSTGSCVPPIPPAVPNIPHYYAPQPQYYQQPYQQPQPADKIPSTYMAWSILFTILCCNAVGVIAIVFSALTSQNINSGNLALAQRYSDYAAYAIIGTIVSSLILSPLQFLMMLL